jgi:hypothetical protein
MTVFSSNRTLVFAAVLTLTSAGLASAQGIDLQIGKHGIRPVVRDDDRGECNPRDALSAARDEGLHRPRITRVSDRTVVVEGYDDDGPDTLRFANVPGCPLR